MSVSAIYAIVCRENGKLYVGSSVNIQKRWTHHRRDLRKGVHGNQPLQNSWTLYGEARFMFMTVEVCDASALRDREIFWIAKLNATDRRFGFNIMKAGWQPTDENRKRAADKASRKLSAAHRKAMSDGRKGMKFSDAHRANIRAAKTGVKYPERDVASKLRQSVAIKTWHQEIGHSAVAKEKIAKGVRAYNTANPTNKWGVPGITYLKSKTKKPWWVRLKVGGKMKDFGSFPSLELATAAAREAAASIISGDFQ